VGGINVVYINRMMKMPRVEGGPPGEGFTNPYIIALGIKLFFVMCLMTLFLYNLIFPPDPAEMAKYYVLGAEDLASWRELMRGRMIRRVPPAGRTRRRCRATA